MIMTEQTPPVLVLSVYSPPMLNPGIGKPYMSSCLMKVGRPAFRIPESIALENEPWFGSSAYCTLLTCAIHYYREIVLFLNPK